MAAMKPGELPWLWTSIRNGAAAGPVFGPRRASGTSADAPIAARPARNSRRCIWVLLCGEVYTLSFSTFQLFNFSAQSFSGEWDVTESHADRIENRVADCGGGGGR